MVSETTEFKSVGANEESAEAFGSRVRSAVIWRSGSQILAQIITWASTLLVIRLLDPSDYGLFAMTQVVLSRSEEHTSELQSLMRISYAVFCLKKKKTTPSELKRTNRENV